MIENIVSFLIFKKIFDCKYSCNSEPDIWGRLLQGLKQEIYIEHNAWEFDLFCEFYLLLWPVHISLDRNLAQSDPSLSENEKLSETQTRASLLSQTYANGFCNSLYSIVWLISITVCSPFYSLSPLLGLIY